MRRSYLDQYGEGEEQRNRFIIRLILTVVIAVVSVSFLWYILKNHHQEGVVKSFLGAVRQGDYQAAYKIWGCTDQKPCSGYEYPKFLGDWRTGGDAATSPDLSVLALTDSETCNNGVLLTVNVNRSRVEKLWVDKSQDSISYSPYPICPHKNPWAIMLHRTIGKLRKPLL
ncbi:MAG TPA: hypothetical protein VNH18_05325 [Bryobacteraceae bacterium]|nr:hypothetical protein [Bryobacteraceae bacterium]